MSCGCEVWSKNDVIHNALAISSLGSTSGRMFMKSIYRSKVTNHKNQIWVRFLWWYDMSGTTFVTGEVGTSNHERSYETVREQLGIPSQSSPLRMSSWRHTRLLPMLKQGPWLQSCTASKPITIVLREQRLSMRHLSRGALGRGQKMTSDSRLVTLVDREILGLHCWDTSKKRINCRWLQVTFQGDWNRRRLEI